MQFEPEPFDNEQTMSRINMAYRFFTLPEHDIENC